MKLFIAGIPGSAKTPFADWLRDEFGFMHIDFELLSNDFQQFLGQHQWNLMVFRRDVSLLTMRRGELGISDSSVVERADA